MAGQRENILQSAQRHGIPPQVLGAVLYNEMIGEEYRLLQTVIPGDGEVPRALRDSLLGWHFVTLKQGQWVLKAMTGLIGLDTTVGPTGIRVSVAREIRQEVAVVGGRYRPSGWAERPSLIIDLVSTPTAIEYLAANLERGRSRADPANTGDWTVLARWHNTGLTHDRPDVPRRVWEKGTRYVARVQEFLPEVTAILHEPPFLPLVHVLPPEGNKAVQPGLRYSRPGAALIGAQ